MYMLLFQYHISWYLHYIILGCTLYRSKVKDKSKLRFNLVEPLRWTLTIAFHSLQNF